MIFSHSSWIFWREVMFECYENRGGELIYFCLSFGKTKNRLSSSQPFKPTIQCKPEDVVLLRSCKARVYLASLTLPGGAQRLPVLHPAMLDAQGTTWCWKAHLECLQATPIQSLWCPILIFKSRKAANIHTVVWQSHLSTDRFFSEYKKYLLGCAPLHKSRLWSCIVNPI